MDEDQTWEWKTSQRIHDLFQKCIWDFGFKGHSLENNRHHRQMMAFIFPNYVEFAMMILFIYKSNKLSKLSLKFSLTWSRMNLLEFVDTSLCMKWGWVACKKNFYVYSRSISHKHWLEKLTWEGWIWWTTGPDLELDNIMNACRWPGAACRMTSEFLWKTGNYLTSAYNLCSGC